MIRQKKFNALANCHRLLWDDLAKSGSKDKTNPYQRAKKLTKDCWCSHCFCCDALSMACFLDHVGALDCRRCPVDWGRDGDGEVAPCERKGALYYQWIRARSNERRSSLAAKIRDLPWSWERFTKGAIR